MFGLLYRDTLDSTTADELDRLTSDLSTVFQVQHNEDGTHNFAPEATTVPLGGVIVWTLVAAPSLWLLCDGSAVNRTRYADLFSVIGETYGAGDGLTTFNLPNFNTGVLVFIIYSGL